MLDVMIFTGVLWTQASPYLLPVAVILSSFPGGFKENIYVIEIHPF